MSLNEESPDFAGMMHLIQQAEQKLVREPTRTEQTKDSSTTSPDESPMRGGTDRELLERAAKAAGIDACWINPDDAEFDSANEGMWLNGERSPDNSKFWNPLTDDGDRYRLARTCDMQINFVLGTARCGNHTEAFTPGNAVEEAYAIVRAAAAIGKEMP
jgi:hypothetical protein